MQNNNYLNRQYLETPSTLRKQLIQNENKLLSPSVAKFNCNFNEQQKYQQEPYNQPTPTLVSSIAHSPSLRKSILKQTNKNYENQQKPLSSPLLNTQITGHNFYNGITPFIATANILSSPLNVNVIDTKWTNSKNKSVINDAPSSQVSSDSGYSGQTAMQIMNNKLNSLSSSPTTNDLNDSFTQTSYEYHKQGNNLLAIQVVKNPGLGFSISGGKDSIGNPFKPNDKVICAS